MSLSKQAGLLPALLLTGCASPSVVVAGSSSGYPIDYALSFSAANLEAATAQLFTLWRHAQVPLFVSGYRQQCLIVVSEGR
ncbi:hypothetical protein [Serratia symbiotica]|uniref:Lipoprotein n=1 Tax=Serratia symbiotica TaxID=138074 RepID=A0A455VN41_9GAMM|nr:hypothetical protein [Serratia symbiotica]BBI92136.1 uncharacterized protein SSYIS1_17100 [Serratia symbiotica]